MSADNGYLLRKKSDGNWVLQIYFASQDEIPEPSDDLPTYATIKEALIAYQLMEEEALRSGYLLSEYGLSMAVAPLSPGGCSLKPGEGEQCDCADDTTVNCGKSSPVI